MLMRAGTAPDSCACGSPTMVSPVTSSPRRDVLVRAPNTVPIAEGTRTEAQTRRLIETGMADLVALARAGRPAGCLNPDVLGPACGGTRAA